MSSFPSSKSFSSTPVKCSKSKNLHMVVDYESPDDSTYSLLSPIYHDSFSDEGEMDAAAQNEDARPCSPMRVELPHKAPDRVGTTVEERVGAKAGTAAEESLNPWEKWLVEKAKEERLKVEKKAEEERKEKEKQEAEEREQQLKKMLVEEKMQEWLKMKKEQERQEKQQKQSREQEVIQQEQLRRREVEQKAEEKYREWLRRKNLEKTERDKREKEEAARREAQEKERRQRAEEKFKEWLASTQDRKVVSPRNAVCYRGGCDSSSYPSPSFYNPIPWKPIHAPPPEKPPEKKTARKKVPNQSKYRHSPGVPFRPRDTLSSAFLSRR